MKNKNLLDIWRSDWSNRFADSTALQRRLDRMWEDLAQLRNPELSSEFVEPREFFPACDLEEAEDHYLLTLDVPGMTKDQLKVELQGKTLVVSGEQTEEKREGRRGQRYHERYSGQFQRSFTLPDIAELDKVEAECKDGVLRVAIPKSATAKSRKIPVGEGKGGLLSRILGKAEEKREQKSAERAA